MLQHLIRDGCLAKLSVVIEGSWNEARPADWRGTARADASIVAVTLLGRPESGCWCKSEPGLIDGQRVRLLLGRYDKLGRDVKVIFGAGGQRDGRTMMPDARYRPDIPARTVCTTGSFVRFAIVAGEPAVPCWLLFLAASDVKVGRDRLWHLRKDLREGVAEPLRSILAYGRTGTLRST